MKQTVLYKSTLDGVTYAASVIRHSGTIAFPTETVYGLGADATNSLAVAKIYEAKGRPSFNPLIVHVADSHGALREGMFNRFAVSLAEAFWPGPLTLVVPFAPTGRVCDLARAGLETIALRIPAHPVALALIQQAGCPIAAPSANRSGHVSPTQSSHVLDDLDTRIDGLIESEASIVGLESTIVSLTDHEPVLLRAGGISREAIEMILGATLVVPEITPDRPVSPGSLASHYAPRASVRLNATEIYAGEAALLFGTVQPEGLENARAVFNMSREGNVVEAASHLYAAMRELDRSGASTIAVVPISEAGLGEAINDRLRRASIKTVA